MDFFKLTHAKMTVHRQVRAFGAPTTDTITSADPGASVWFKSPMEAVEKTSAAGGTYTEDQSAVADEAAVADAGTVDTSATDDLPLSETDDEIRSDRTEICPKTKRAETQGMSRPIKGQATIFWKYFAIFDNLDRLAICKTECLR